MNGLDKGLVLYQGHPLITHLLTLFSPQVSSCIISANRNVSRYQQYGHPIYRDSFGDYSGPLSGILTALKHCKTDWLACVPCDALNIPTDLVQQLHEHTTKSNALLGIVDDGERWQPLYSIIHRSLVDNLEEYLHTGNKRVMQWVEEQSPIIVDYSNNRGQFKNINSLDDLHR